MKRIKSIAKVSAGMSAAAAAPAAAEEVALHVAVRLRPKLPRERAEATFWAPSPDAPRTELRCLADASYRVNDRRVPKRHGPYARVFAPDATTEDVHAEIVAPIADAFLDGFNGCVFAYGQTGSGKTHTLMGSHADAVAAADAGPAAAAAATALELGVVQRTVMQVLRRMQRDGAARRWFLRISYLEIYNEKLKDLLRGTPGVDGVVQEAGAKLSVYEDAVLGPAIRHLTEVPVTGLEQLHALILKGEKRRAVGRTNMNEHSSRSHTMFRLVLESAPREAEGAAAAAAADADAAADAADADDVTVSQLFLVDLAGSENVKKSGVAGKRLKEAAHINKSLSQLTLVIMQLAERSHYDHGSYQWKKVQIHYRDSKLTHVLSACLGGNARTALICAASPAEKSLSETYSTLAFAQRAAQVINRVVKVRVDSKSALMGRHLHDVEALRAALGGGGGGGGDGSQGISAAEAERLDEERRALASRAAAAEAAQATAQAEALEERGRNTEHRGLLQATHALKAAFPDDAALHARIQQSIVGPVHGGEMEPHAALAELEAICRDRDGADGGDGGDRGDGGDEKEGTTLGVLRASLRETAADRAALMQEATAKRALARRLEAAESGVAGAPGEGTLEDDADWQRVCAATDALAARFGCAAAADGAEGAEGAEARPVNESMMASMEDDVMQPLLAGTITSTQALAKLQKLCAHHAREQDDAEYLGVFDRATGMSEVAGGGTPGAGDGEGEAAGGVAAAAAGVIDEDGEGEAAPVAPAASRSPRSPYVPLSQRMASGGARHGGGTPSAIDAQMATMNKRIAELENRKHERIKNKDPSAGGKGRMCTGGEDTCSLQ